MRGVHGGNPGAGQDAQDQGADTAKVREKESTATVLIQHGSEKCRYMLIVSKHLPHFSCN